MQVNGTALRMIRGDSEAITVKVTDRKGKVMPLVTGDTVYLTVKGSAYDTEYVLQVIVTEFGDDGSALIAIRPEDTKDLAFGALVYDVQVTFEDETVKTVIPPSPFVIGEEVTYD